MLSVLDHRIIGDVHFVVIVIDVANNVIGCIDEIVSTLLYILPTDYI